MTGRYLHNLLVDPSRLRLKLIANIRGTVLQRFATGTWARHAKRMACNTDIFRKFADDFLNRFLCSRKGGDIRHLSVPLNKFRPTQKGRRAADFIE